MLLGIPYLWWILALGIVAVFLSVPGKKKSNEDEPKHFGLFTDDVDEYVKSLQEIVEMRWVRLRVNPEDLDTVLNKIEETKISVMYQFFLRENKYDMLFRCQKSKIEQFEEFLKEYI